jgi:putative ABC transport system substrate-binding protein
VRAGRPCAQEADPFFLAAREKIVGLVARHSLPALYAFREFVLIGGLMSYGTSLSNAYQEAGVYAGKILKGVPRRELLVLLGGAAACPLAARAQQPVMPLIGFISNLSHDPIARPMAAFRQGLKDTGHVEGQDVAIEYRWAQGELGRLPALAADLVQRRPTVIVATGGGSSALAAKAATTTIPIVFSASADPIQLGLVTSLNRPGGNLTGTFLLANSLEGKRLGLLHEMVPKLGRIAVMVNPQTPGAESQLADAHSAAATFARQIVVLKASTEHDLEAAFTTLIQSGGEALLVAADPFFNSRRAQIITLAARHAVPAIYEFREFAVAGGLMSYGPSLSSAYHQVGIYTGRILKGEKAADLPVVQPTTFELVINLKTAKGLGLEPPATLLARADDVIE